MVTAHTKEIRTSAMSYSDCGNSCESVCVCVFVVFVNEKKFEKVFGEDEY